MNFSISSLFIFLQCTAYELAVETIESYAETVLYYIEKYPNETLMMKLVMVDGRVNY